MSERPAALTIAEEDDDAHSHEPLRRGALLGRYVVLEALGRGGMGEVFAAYDPELDRKLAIKVLKPERAGSGRGQLRMMREAQALAKLSHPNVVAIHDVGTHAGRVFVAMEFVAGRTLRAWLEDRPRGWRAIVEVWRAAGRGLAAAHAKGIVHRDFKPDNVMVSVDGQVRVLDFGLAHAHRSEGGDPPEATGSEEIDLPLGLRSSTLDSRITRHGAVLGTPAYMSPEQHLGQPTDASTDQFSFCVSLYEALYGEAPFGGDTPQARAYAVTTGEIRPAPRGTKVPAFVRRLLLRGLSVRPQDRHVDLVHLLDGLGRDPAATRRRIALACGGIAALGVAIAASGAARSGVDCDAGREALAGTWDDTARGRVRDAFAAIERPWAQRAAGAVQGALDRWADLWVEGHEDACLATHVRRDQSQEAFDLRMRCLSQARADLAAVVDVLAGADADLAARALDTVAGLPPPSACADVVALRARAPLPETADARARAEAIGERVAAVRAWAAAGRYADAVGQAREAVEDAEGLDWAPGRAAALGALGAALDADGHPREAEPILVDAAVAGELGGDDGLLSDVRTQLAGVVGDRLERPREGHVWAALARASIERAGGDPAREVALELCEARLYAAQGEHVLELAHEERALARLADVPDPLPSLEAGIHTALAGTLGELGRHDEALGHAQTGVAVLEGALGPDHPQVGTALAGLALTHDYAGRYARALPIHRRAVEVLERALGPDHPRVAEALNNQAIALVDQGDLAGGEASFRRVLEIRRAALGEDHPGIAQALANLGGVLRMQLRHAEAREVLERALEVRRARLPADHADIGSSLAALGNLAEDEHDYARAEDLRRQALAIAAQTFGAESPQLLVDLGNLAYTRARLGRRADAITTAERALAILSRHEVAPDVRAFVHIAMARALTTGGRRDPAAREHVEAAQAALGDLPAPWERKLLAELAHERGSTR
jgi:tetratricopeptide (TPR) repeat protein/predicted Ser/Thr protein kinase